LSSLSKENAERAAQHLLAAAFYVDTDPRRAHLHGVAASARAGRVGRVREVAGYAAYHAREFEIAIRELRAANRISGDGSMWPVLADSERGIGRPQKAVEMAKDPQVKLLDIDGQVEMKIVVAGARRDLKQVDAAVATLKCAELENETASWAARLRYAYADALEASGDHKNAQKWFVKSAEIDINQATDANERIKSN
jgi:tetratricopeptide (TPR) repeat protein